MIKGRHVFSALLVFLSFLTMGIYLYWGSVQTHVHEYAIGLWVFAAALFIAGISIYYNPPDDER